MRSIRLLLYCCTIPGMLQAQQYDSMRVTLPAAESLFLKKNLPLMAAYYQADAVKANEIQKKLYPNPSISTELAAYGADGRWLDIGKNGQKSFGVQQLIILAGKRNKQLQLAREQSREAGLQFYDLLRTLKFSLRQDYFTLAYSQELIRQYDEQMRLLRQLIKAYDEQSLKKNVSLKDAVRLKTEYIQLSSDRNSIIMEAISARQNLQQLLDTSAVIIPVLEPAGLPPLPALAVLLEKAHAARPDLQIEESRVKQEQLNLRVQQALAKPDLTLVTGYDQQGSYTRNLYTIRAAIDIPFFNRNQGNIKAAQSMIRSAELMQQYKQSSVEKEVVGSLARWQEAEREFKESQESFNKEFPAVNQSVIENFNKGNISLLEFLDFFENYNSAIRQLNQLGKQRQLAREELEYTVGSPIN